MFLYWYCQFFMFRLMEVVVSLFKIPKRELRVVNISVSETSQGHTIAFIR